jgi:4-alpha-glucanotransferase
MPGDDETEESASANRQNGERLLSVMKEAAGNAVVIGEDLGVVPPYVRPSLMELGISGFKIPVFERDLESREWKPPEEYPSLTVATLSTHDHQTLAGLWEAWWTTYEAGRKNAPPIDTENREPTESEKASWELYRTLRFARLDDRELIRDYSPLVREGACRRLLESASWLAILSITDLYGLDLRFNVPGVMAASNWSTRFPATVEELGQDEEWKEIGLFAEREIYGSGRFPF